MLPKLYGDAGKKLINIAHRGASAYFPENTMPSFAGAVAMQADMVELDVQLTKDSVPVVFHDARLKNHTNGTGKISDYTLQELKKLDAGSWFNTRFAGTPIPMLEEVLAYTSGKIAVNIEIKTEAVRDRRQGGVEQQCLELAQKYGMGKHVLFSSFDYRAVSRLKKLAPQMPVAILYDKNQSEDLLPSQLIKKYNADAFNCSYRQLTHKWLADLQSNNIPFFIYTVDQPRQMNVLIKKGAAGIFTNKPDVLNGVINTWKKDS